MTYTVLVGGRYRFAHADHLRVNECVLEENATIPSPSIVSPQRICNSPVKSPIKQQETTVVTSTCLQHDNNSQQPAEVKELINPTTPDVTLRRSQRERRPPRIMDL